MAHCSMGEWPELITAPTFEVLLNTGGGEGPLEEGRFCYKKKDQI